MSEQGSTNGIRARKFRRWFEAVDADDDGAITRHDMTVMSERYIAARNASSDSPDAQRLTTALDGLWSGLIGAADRDGDGRVTFTEMLAVLEPATTDPELYPDQFGQVGELFFQLADTNGDDKIDLEEFTHIFGATGRASGDECAEVFDQLDLDGSRALSRSEYHRALARVPLRERSRGSRQSPFRLVARVGPILVTSAFPHNRPRQTAVFIAFGVDGCAGQRPSQGFTSSTPVSSKSLMSRVHEGARPGTGVRVRTR